MGGHGGINILHQKAWHVYNNDNQSQVERDKRIAKHKQARDFRNRVSVQLGKRYAYLRHKRGLPAPPKRPFPWEGEGGRERGEGPGPFVSKEKKQGQ